MTQLGQQYCNQADINAAIGAGGLISYQNVWFYDGAKVYHQIADYTGDNSWRTCAGYVTQAYTNWIMAVTAGADWPVGALAGHDVFPHGLLIDYQRTGSSASKTAVHKLAANSAWAGNGGDAACTGTRETAYILEAYLAAEDIGEPRNPLLATSINYALGHIDQWFVSKSCSYMQPFMVGLTMEALIRAYDKTGDARIPGKIQLAADALWDTAWMPASQAFYYISTDSPLQPAGDLNLLIAPAYAWLWQKTGDSKYLDRGDQIFAGGVLSTIWGGKQFSQNYRWSFDYVRWRSAPSPSTTPAVLTGVQLNPATVAGNTTTAQNLVVLSAAAPSSGLTISLSSSNPAAASVPASVVVPAGATSAAFPITISSVAADTNVIITASAAGVTKTASLTIKAPAPALSAFTISPASLSAGGNALATVTLTGAAPANGAAISITNSQPGVVTTPSNITIPAGSTSGTFSVTAASLATANSATISVSYAGAEKSTAVSVSAVTTVSLTSFSISPATVAAGGQATGTVTLSAAAPAGGATVLISSANAAAVSTPQSVTVPAGSSTAVFPITAGSPAASTTVPVTVTYAGANQAASLTVTAPAVAPPAPTAASYSVSAPAAASPGSTIVVTWTAPQGHPSGDFLVLCTDAVGYFLPTTGPATSGSLNVQLPATAGKYSIRYYSYVGNVWTVVAQSPYIAVQ